jgi:hypothetical protein
VELAAAQIRAGDAACVGKKLDRDNAWAVSIVIAVIIVAAPIITGCASW